MWSSENFWEYIDLIEEQDIHKSWCEINIDNSNVLQDFNTSNQDTFKLVEWLDDFWDAKYLQFSENPSWPVLVIFREHHQNNEVKKENFEAFIKMKEYFNFLATEWTDVEISWELLQLQWNIKKSIDLILNWGASFSSQVIEEYYQNQLNTCWVDQSSIEFSNSKQTQRDILNYDITWNVDDILARMENNQRKLDKYIQNNVLENRNTLWLENMKNILLTWNNTNWKNFLPIVAGWAHAEDLSKQAKNFWFKWVIVFTPNSYK